MIFTVDWRFVSSIGVADAATAKAAIASDAEWMVTRMLAEFQDCLLFVACWAERNFQIVIECLCSAILVSFETKTKCSAKGSAPLIPRMSQLVQIKVFGMASSWR